MNFFKKIIFGSSSERTLRTGPAKLSVVSDRARPRMWAVGGGKGGVGKSLVAANLGVLLSKQGKRVLLVDADLGAANLHTFLGADGARQTLSNFLKSDSDDIGQYIGKTGIACLDLVSGAKDSLGVADQTPVSIVRLTEALMKVDYDHIVLDVGPGTAANNLDLFLMADEGVLVTTPEPTSIENTYRFLKCLFLRRIRNISRSQQDSKLKDMLNRVLTRPWAGKIRTVADILQRIRELDPEKEEMLKELMGNTGVSLIVNQSRKPADSLLGPSMARACKDYFGIDIGFLGEIRYEEIVTESVRARRPLVMDYGNAEVSKAISSCLEKLSGKGKIEMKKACPGH